MANSSLVLSSLDFDTLKSNFKEFLKTQSVLKDYNFDGANMNVLLDVMSYNSYLNSFYLNMVASEMFLDSAQKYDSVVSHAKELNYLPRSAHSAAANVSFTIQTTGIGKKFTIPKGTRFFGTNANGSFSFVTQKPTIYTSSNGTFTVNNLQIKEGAYFRDSFVVDYDIEDQKFVLSNQNIDVDSVTVQVIEDNDFTNPLDFLFAETLFGLDKNSKIYFLQGADNNKYEITFGDGYFGRKPKNGATIRVDYVITNGYDGNGVEEFNITDDLGTVNGGTATIAEVVTLSVSNSGSDQETLSSVKFSAPRYFATQQRAVTSDDYTSLVLNNFGGEVADVVVYGGQDVEPKKYGRVLICIKPIDGTIAPDYIKNKISNYMLEYIALPNRIELTDPEYLYVSVETTIQYDPYVTDKTPEELETIVLNAIRDYSLENLEKFANDLRYSRLISDIDNSDVGITSNSTELRIIKRIAPKINFPTTFNIDLNNTIYYEGQTVDTGIPHTELYLTSFDTHVEHAAIISSRFTFIFNGTNFVNSYIADDGAGTLKVYCSVNNVLTALQPIGTVNYETGYITINDILVAEYSNYISLYVRSRDLDIYADKNMVIIIDPSDVIITTTETIR